MAKGKNMLMLMHETRIFYFTGVGIEDAFKEATKLIETIIS